MGGLKTPRYLLFGDTVNTASRIEAMGVEMRVHASDTCAALLEKDGRFLLEARPEPLDIPGYKRVTTFWLLDSLVPRTAQEN